MSILAVSMLLGGCQDYGFEELPRSVIKEKRWSQTISVSSSADILFVVDNSGSMAGEQDQLGRSFSSFAQVLEEKFGDVFHIAIVTTGMESLNCPRCSVDIPGSCINETGENGRFQDRLGHITWNAGTPVFDFVQDRDCRVVTNDNTDCFYNVDQERGIALVGTTGCGFERGLAPLRPALDDLRGDYNAQFLRNDATLAVIIISDEDDCGEVNDIYENTVDMGNVCYFASKGVGPEPGNPDYTPMTYHPGDPEQRPYELTPVEDYYDFLVNDVKGGRTGMVKFAAIVGMTDVNDPSTTTIEYTWDPRGRWEINNACTTPGCTGTYCFAEPGTRYIKLAQMFGIGQNGFLDTICQNNFAETMEELGSFVACPRQFKLSEPPLDPDLASILINGEQVPLYSCSIPDRLETCSGPGASCSQGSCVLTWIYCRDSGSAPECAGLDFSNAAGGVITFADHYDPCDLISEGEVHIEFVYVPQG
jgi:hypothetical protein